VDLGLGWLQKDRGHSADGGPPAGLGLLIVRGFVLHGETQGNGPCHIPKAGSQRAQPVATSRDGWDDRPDESGSGPVSSARRYRHAAPEAALTPDHARSAGRSPRRGPIRRLGARRWPVGVAFVALVIAVAVLIAVVGLN